MSHSVSHVIGAKKNKSLSPERKENKDSTFGGSRMEKIH